jgi:hypothetical protein
MSKIVSMLACCAVASLFSFGAQALPSYPAPAQMAASEFIQIEAFAGSAFTAGPTVAVCPMMCRTAM